VNFLTANIFLERQNRKIESLTNVYGRLTDRWPSTVYKDKLKQISLDNVNRNSRVAEKLKRKVHSVSPFTSIYWPLLFRGSFICLLLCGLWDPFTSVRHPPRSGDRGGLHRLWTHAEVFSWLADVVTGDIQFINSAKLTMGIGAI